MKILYLGANSGNSKLRELAMRRLGHEVMAIDPYKALPSALVKWGFKSGYLGISHAVRQYVNARIQNSTFDLVWVDQGDACNADLIGDLRRHRVPIVNYCQDNPYVKRDGYRWRQLLRAIPEYNLIVTPRESNVATAYEAGARAVMRVMFAADEVVHRAQQIEQNEVAEYTSQVSFVGTWMPERGSFLISLLKRGVAITIFGPRWEKAPEFPALKPYLRLGPLSSQRYVKAIQCSSIAIGLLSKGNEDLHTTRSIEIPAIGTLFCAERTSEHMDMYNDGEEAVFWKDAAECADVCLNLLNDPQRLTAIAKAGHERALKNGNFNENLISSVLKRLSSVGVEF
ncbi:glycosyltransferase [Bradyrhizobium sp. ERR14]|uniref:CgeB family protein n=1 Tax=Bradyrhizobium sp. ERR14 TaxID=2663837 RepID=UPI00161FE40D|nr:glycosyltransferase [Bradyrhizobium sp. ERR14]MBB4396207.1 spore maturation protein CgeB [Bradyrhizobium sp. ERR14]